MDFIFWSIPLLHFYLLLSHSLVHYGLQGPASAWPYIQMVKHFKRRDYELVLTVSSSHVARLCFLFVTKASFRLLYVAESNRDHWYNIASAFCSGFWNWLLLFKMDCNIDLFTSSSAPSSRQQSGILLASSDRTFQDGSLFRSYKKKSNQNLLISTKRMYLMRKQLQK